MSNQYPHPFSNISRKYRSFRRSLPEVISNIALNDFKHNFKRQGYVNANGVFIPWKGTRQKGRRTMGRKSKGILIGKGRLLRSMRRAATSSEARVVSNLPYASVHNEGFKKNVSVKSHSRNKYRKAIETVRTRSGKYKDRVVNVKSGKTTVKAHQRKMNIERRPFMTTSKTITEETEKHIFKELDKIWNS